MSEFREFKSMPGFNSDMSVKWGGKALLRASMVACVSPYEFGGAECCIITVAGGTVHIVEADYGSVAAWWRATIEEKSA